MSRTLSILGIAITFVYLGILWFIFDGRLTEILLMPPNEIGDLLAGMFGPLAILWLILGFFQQGIELRQNTKALNLQAEELKNSVEQQREVAAAANKQAEAIRDSQKPIFSVRFSPWKGDHLIMIIHNSGQSANNITAKAFFGSDDQVERYIAHMQAQSENELSFDEVHPGMRMALGMKAQCFVCLVFEYGNGLRGEEYFDFMSNESNTGGFFVNRKATPTPLVK